MSKRVEPLSEKELRVLEAEVKRFWPNRSTPLNVLRLIATIRTRDDEIERTARDLLDREANIREARELLEEATGHATGFAKSAGLPMTESLMGRIIIFLQRTERQGGEP